MKILYINPLLLYPTIQGNQRTGLNRVKYLSKNNEVVLLAFYSSKKELEAALEVLNKYCTSVIPIYLPLWKRVLNIIFGSIFSKLPLQILYHQSHAFQKIINELDDLQFDIFHFNTIRMAPYAFGLKTPVLIDLHDSMILNIKRRLKSEKPIKKIMYYFELFRINKYERYLVKTYKHLMVLAEQDKFIHTPNHNIDVIHLGVDDNEFKPDNLIPNNKTIIFSGNMSYTPNVDAVIWFIDNCWSKVILEVPDAKFKIVGANPSPLLDRYKSIKSIEISGRVKSMIDELNNSQFAIAPLRSGSGMQNKVLEAMSCGIPVVCTKIGLGDIRADINEEIFVADTPQDFTEKCILLLNNHTLCLKVGQKSRKFINENYSISYHCDSLEKLYKKIINERSVIPQ